MSVRSVLILFSCWTRTGEAPGAEQPLAMPGGTPSTSTAGTSRQQEVREEQEEEEKEEE